MSEPRRKTRATPSPRFIESALRTDRQRRLDQPDGYGRLRSDCGDVLEVFLAIEAGRIQAATYRLLGCLNTNACANAVVELAAGRSVAEAWRIRPDDVAGLLETLPDGHYHCARLAVDTLRRALADHQRLSRHPWRKAYRRQPPPAHEPGPHALPGGGGRGPGRL